MVTELTPDNFFESLQDENVLSVIMFYGNTCGPCKITMPVYEAMAAHFIEYQIPNVKFFRMHFWEKEYKPFFTEHNITTKGVPTFKYYFNGDVLTEFARAFPDPNELKRETLEVMKAIDKIIQGVFGHATR